MITANEARAMSKQDTTSRRAYFLHYHEHLIADMDEFIREAVHRGDSEATFKLSVTAQTYFDVLDYIKDHGFNVRGTMGEWVTESRQDLCEFNVRWNWEIRIGAPNSEDMF